MLGEELLIFKNANIVNVFTKEIIKGHFGVLDEKFLFVEYNQRFSEEVIKNLKIEKVKEIDLKGAYVTPTFIDGHIHIESSHLVPSEFEKFALKTGVSKVVIDPHEIANVFGAEGIKFMLFDAKLLDVYVMIPSCVPASPLETSGAVISAKEIKDLINFHERVLGLAEVMNFPGVINEEPEVLEKIKIAKNAKKLVDGHAPLLRGFELNKYIFHGIMSDHECVEGEEALEKFRLGMWVMVREGTSSKNLYLLENLKRVGDLRRIMLVSDDVSFFDLSEYMLNLLRKAVKYVDVLTAIQMVTINPAMYFNLSTGIKPGEKADFLVFKNLEKFELEEVWIKGKSLSFWEEHFDRKQDNFYQKFTESFNVRKQNLENLLIEGLDKERVHGRVRVIKPLEGSLITKEVLIPVEDAIKLMEKGEINRIYVLERHKGTGKIGKGLIWGVLKEGAIASSYAHDSHNIIAIGKDIEDIVIAINTLIDIKGGFVIVKDKKVVSAVPLEIGGIMTANSSILKDKLTVFYKELKKLTPFKDLLLDMSFFSLSVIPELKITEKGLIKNFQIVPLIES